MSAERMGDGRVEAVVAMLRRHAERNRSSVFERGLTAAADELVRARTEEARLLEENAVLRARVGVLERELETARPDLGFDGGQAQ